MRLNKIKKIDSWWHHRKKQNYIKSRFSMKIGIFLVFLSYYFYKKEELGTKTACSQLCINLVLRCYANRLNFSAMIVLKASFISSGKKERSINSNHFSFAFTNLLKIFPITFSSNPDACIEATKSAFLILRFLPLRVSANSSKGMS